MNAAPPDTAGGAPVASAREPRRGLAAVAWIAALALLLAFIVRDSDARIRHLEAVTAVDDVVIDPPLIDAASPTGYAGGVRRLVLPFDDGLHWIMQTQAMLARHELRVREVDYDNAPPGRAVHWASPFRWWIALLAAIDHAIAHQPPGICVERTALYANPLLLALVAVALVVLVARRCGAIGATLVALALLAMAPLQSYFVAGYLDHHGAAAACALFTSLLLAAGVTARDETAAISHASPLTSRGWFVASGVVGGIGLWISAASQTPVLLGLGAGACAAMLWTRRARDLSIFDPAAWRSWGIAGAATSAVAYLIEYFPSHLGLRFEVNHPLYALAWLGAGELLARIASRVARQERGENTRGLARWIGAAAALLQLPLLVVLTRADTFHVADPFLWALHKQYIAEFQTLASHLAREPSVGRLLALASPALLLVIALVSAWRRGVSDARQAQLVLTAIPGALLLVMALAQARWWGISYALLLVTIWPLTAQLAQNQPPHAGRFLSWARGCCFALLLPGAALAAARTFAPADEPPITRDELLRVAQRGLAQRLRQRLGDEPAVVLGGPVATSMLAYFGGLRGLGTFYWENLDGLTHAAEIYAASSADEAQRLIRQYGVTHLVALSWDNFESEYVRLFQRSPQPRSGGSFAARLLRDGEVPAWLRPLPFRLPTHPAFAGQTALVFEVVAEQTPEEALVRETQYFLEMGATTAVAGLEPALARATDYLPAQITLARIQRQRGETQPFAITTQQILRRLPLTSPLTSADRVHLALVLAQAGETARAREQLAQLYPALDARELRRLDPGALANLLHLGEQLAAPVPDPRLRALARRLLPPYLRDR